MFYLLALTAGIFSVAWWQAILPTSYIFALFVACIPLVLRRWGRLFLCLLLGICWGLYSAEQVISHVMPASLHKEDFLVTGTVEGLVDAGPKSVRFVLRVDSTELPKHADQEYPFKKLLLNWYVGGGGNSSKELLAGQKWRVKVRLRQLRGFVNPGGFDYQGWLLQQGVSATGYVLSAEKVSDDDSQFNLSLLREKLRTEISNADLSPRETAVLLALTIGDKHSLAPWWNDLARWGIVHLVVISGLHIGMVAGLGFWAGKCCSRLTLLVHPYWGARWLPPLFSIALAAVYSLLAGFSLPTQRALIAVVVVMVAKLAFRKVSAVALFIWALLLIAITQPLAVLNSGFWLSFLAVRVLIWSFSPWRLSHHYWDKWRRLIYVQFALVVVLSVPLLLFIGRASWLGPLVNLIAVPWVSFVSVPLALLSALLVSLGMDVSSLFLQWAGWSVSVLLNQLDRLSVPGFFYSPFTVNGPTLLALSVAVFSVVLPKGMPCKWLGLLPVGLMVLFPLPDKPLKVTVLDVGQGLAVVVQTPEGALLYDTGPQYSERFSAGNGIVAPYLWCQGRSDIDHLIISHEDGDHAGGYSALREVMDIGKVQANQGVFSRWLSSAPERLAKGNFEVCWPGNSWDWGEVHFRILAPLDVGPQSGNNSSCVLQITWNGVSVLLPGDIEAEGEYRLLKHADFNSKVDVLIAPHHGSKTSSTHEFVEALAPKHVVFSAGYQHSFGHPHSDVVKRYHSIGSQMWNTGEQGAITFTWDKAGELHVEAQREFRHYWWQQL